MVKQLLSALLGTQAPPVAPDDMSVRPQPEDRTSALIVGWLVVAALAVLIVASAVGIIASLA